MREFLKAKSVKKLLPTGVTVLQVKSQGVIQIIVPHAEVKVFRFGNIKPNTYVSDRIKYLADMEATRIANHN